MFTFENLNKRESLGQVRIDFGKPRLNRSIIINTYSLYIYKEVYVYKKKFI